MTASLMMPVGRPPVSRHAGLFRPDAALGHAAGAAGHAAGAALDEEDGPCGSCEVVLTRRAPGGGSLDGDGGAGALEGGLGLLRSVLGDLLQDRLRRAVDQVLGLLEAERGQAAHLLDDLDLLVAGALEDDVELVLLLSGGGATVAGTTGGRGGRDGDRSSGGEPG